MSHGGHGRSHSGGGGLAVLLVFATVGVLAWVVRVGWRCWKHRHTSP